MANNRKLEDSQATQPMLAQRDSLQVLLWCKWAWWSVSEASFQFPDCSTYCGKWMHALYRDQQFEAHGVNRAIMWSLAAIKGSYFLCALLYQCCQTELSALTHLSVLGQLQRGCSLPGKLHSVTSPYQGLQTAIFIKESQMPNQSSPFKRTFSQRDVPRQHSHELLPPKLSGAFLGNLH